MISLEYGWRCLDCAEHGEGPTSDKQAEKHTKASLHGTTSWGRPKGAGDGEAADAPQHGGRGAGTMPG